VDLAVVDLAKDPVCLTSAETGKTPRVACASILRISLKSGLLSTQADKAFESIPTGACKPWRKRKTANRKRAGNGGPSQETPLG
jgi:hypothetical protein